MKQAFKCFLAKNGQNTDLNHKNVVWGTTKNPEKGQEGFYPGQPLTFMFKSIEI